MRIAGKVALGKSAELSENIHLDGLFQNLKKGYLGFFSSLRGPWSTLWGTVVNQTCHCIYEVWYDITSIFPLRIIK